MSISNKAMAYQATTEGIRVRVVPHYLADQSDPSKSRWVWAYQVEIHNEGNTTVQVRDRHWDITDANGKVQVVDGAGVVGKQPVLRPGESFNYTSGCPLPTSSGFMAGHYGVVALEEDESEPFKVAIPAFSLDVPASRGTRLN